MSAEFSCKFKFQMVPQDGPGIDCTEGKYVIVYAFSKRVIKILMRYGIDLKREKNRHICELLTWGDGKKKKERHAHY